MKHLLDKRLVIIAVEKEKISCFCCVRDTGISQTKRVCDYLYARQVARYPPLVWR